MPIRQLSRDPFARTTLLRDSLARAGRRPCKWCGSADAKYIYGWDADSVRVRPVPWDGPFCGVECYRAFHS